jgi:basic membrane protein A
MKKVCLLMVFTMILLSFGTAFAVGMPEAHGVSGRDFGKMVSELAKSSPGAVAEHVKAMRGPVGKDALKVVLLVNGSLEDPFYASAYQGMEMIKDEFGAIVKTIVLPEDEDALKSKMVEVSEKDYDIIIVGTWLMEGYLDEVAVEFPDQKYIIFDGTVDLPNVFSIRYKVHEAAFLAGALAVMVTGSDLPHANENDTIGFIGGMNIDVINQFLAGYQGGANYVDTNAEVIHDYIGDFNDVEAAKEMALSQYEDGVDVIFAAAGASGYGMFEAAKTSSFYAIGVDVDQALQYENDENVDSDLILTSVVKHIGHSLLYAVQLHVDGTLDYGSTGYWGLAEGAVGLVDNENYQNLPIGMRANIDAITEDIIDETILVPDEL